MKLFFQLLLILLLTPSAGFTKIEVLLPGLEKTGGGTIRYLGIFKVYDAELFTRPDLHADAVLSDNTSKCLVLSYDLDISAEDIINGANAILKRQHSTEVLENASQEIEILHNSYTDVSSGDRYALCYNAQSSVTKLLFNDVEVVEIQSTEFARLYFGIWLGSKEPISQTLREDLLSRLDSQG